MDELILIDDNNKEYIVKDPQRFYEHLINFHTKNKIGPPGDGRDAGPGTDFYAIADNSVSITPIQIDMTNHKILSDMDLWLTE